MKQHSQNLDTYFNARPAEKQFWTKPKVETIDFDNTQGGIPEIPEDIGRLS